MLLLFVCVAAQCRSGQEPPARDNQTDQNQAADVSADGIARLEREAREIAKSEGCSSTGECRSAPVGARACGGPRDYIVYCARTTDTTALFRKLNELRQAEIEYNRKNNVASTCEFRSPPEIALVGASCRAQEQGPVGMATGVARP